MIWPNGMMSKKPEVEVQVTCSAVIKDSGSGSGSAPGPGIQETHSWKISSSGRGLGSGCVEGWKIFFKLKNLSRKFLFHTHDVSQAR